MLKSLDGHSPNVVRHSERCMIQHSISTVHDRKSMLGQADKELDLRLARSIFNIYKGIKVQDDLDMIKMNVIRVA